MPNSVPYYLERPDISEMTRNEMVEMIARSALESARKKNPGNEMTAAQMMAKKRMRKGKKR